MAISISFHGYSGKALQAMEIAVKNRASDFLIVSDRPAEVYIVDVSGVGGDAHVSALSVPKERTLLIVEKSIPEYTHQLVKPVGFTNLINAAREIAAKSPNDFGKPEVASQVAVSEMSRVDIDKYLVGALVKKRAEFQSGMHPQGAIKLDISEDGWIVVDFIKGAVFSNVSQRQLIHFAHIRTDRVSIKQSAIASGSLPSGVRTAQHLDVLLWEIASHAIDRALIAGISFTGHYRLAEWPNVPKLKVDERLYSVISLWVKSEFSIESLCKKFPDMRKEIIILANQAFISGILKGVNATVHNASEKPHGANPLRGIMRLIAKKIGVKAA